MTEETILKVMKKTMAEMLLENNKLLMSSVDDSIEKAIRFRRKIGKKAY